jgi:RNA polymerase sigma factor (sigma-70 family)
MPPSRPASPGAIDDGQILASCLAGDEAAWQVLVERYSRLVYSIAFKSGLDETEAADLVQDVFTIVLRRLESLQQVDRFSAWLITIANREAWRLKRSRAHIPLPDAFDVPDGEAALEATVIAWEHAATVQAALARLDDRCRRLLELLFVHDPRPSYDEIGSRLGIAIGSIGPIRARCLGRLRQRLADAGVVDVAG